MKMSFHGQAVLDAIQALASCGADCPAIRATLETIPTERWIFVMIHAVTASKITRASAYLIINEIGWVSLKDDLGEQSFRDLVALVECLA